MQRNLILLCLGLLCLASAQHAGVVDPRGARPVEHGTRADKCATQKEWPFCVDDDWGSKCPSGCRIQGLLDTFDHGAQKKIEKIRNLLDDNRAKHRSADQVSKQTYDYLKEKLVTDSGHDTNYYDLAQSLRQRITDMKIKIDRQLRILAALKDRVKDQVVDMQKLEVDIDIKLRSCKGSCQSYSEYQVDHESYVALDKQVSQLDSHAPQNIESVGTLYVMKSRPLQDVVVDSIYKSKEVAAQQAVDMFPGVNTLQLVLEEEGSSSSPATISKVPVCVRLKQQIQDGRPPPHRKRHCRAKSDVPLCSDDDWVPKCPSGCRVQGLIWQTEAEVDRKLKTLCKTGRLFEDQAEKTMRTMVHIYNDNRRLVVHQYVSELKFVEKAEALAANLTSLRKRSSMLSLQLDGLREKVQRQIVDLIRTEVDVDVKLRSCRGSCRSVTPFSLDHLSYRALQTDLDHMDKTRNQRRRTTVPPPEDLPNIRLQALDIDPTPSPEYKTIPTVRRELLTQFEDIGQNQVVLEDLLEDSVDPHSPTELQ